MIRQKLKRIADNLFREESTEIYYLIVKLNGKQIRRSLKTSDRELAKRRLAIALAEVGRVNGEDCPLMELAGRYLASVAHQKGKTIDRKKAALVQIQKLLPVTVRGVTPTRLEEWKRRREKQVGPRTFNIERITLAQVMKYAVKCGIVARNPVLDLPRLVERKKAVVAPTREGFSKVIAEMRKSEKAQRAANMCELMAYSGTRLGEATNICWRDVDFERKTLTITGGTYGTKNHADRVMPMFAPLEDLLRRILASWPIEAKPDDKVLQTTSADKAIFRACRDTGVDEFTHHELRHFFAVNCKEAGVDFPTLGYWLGHSDGGLLASRTYGHLRNEHSLSQAAKITFSASTPSPRPETPR